MSNQLTSNVEALRLFFTDDVYLVKQDTNAGIAHSILAPEKQEIEVKVTSASSETVLLLPSVEKPMPSFPKEKITFEYLGKNQQGILILVNDAVNKVSTPQGTELLRKLVKAIELTNNDFALVNYANYPTAIFQDLQQFFEVKIVLSFGVSAQQLGLADHTLHTLHQSANTKFIFTHELHGLDEDATSKKMLWASLKQLK